MVCSISAGPYPTEYLVWGTMRSTANLMDMVPELGAAGGHVHAGWRPELEEIGKGVMSMAFVVTPAAKEATTGAVWLFIPAPDASLPPRTPAVGSRTARHLPVKR